jgi:hypothetical protein
MLGYPLDRLQSMSWRRHSSHVSCALSCLQRYAGVEENIRGFMQRQVFSLNQGSGGQATL